MSGGVPDDGAGPGNIRVAAFGPKPFRGSARGDLYHGDRLAVSGCSLVESEC